MAVLISIQKIPTRPFKTHYGVTLISLVTIADVFIGETQMRGWEKCNCHAP